MQSSKATVTVTFWFGSQGSAVREYFAQLIDCRDPQSRRQTRALAHVWADHNTQPPAYVEINQQLSKEERDAIKTAQDLQWTIWQKSENRFFKPIVAIALEALKIPASVGSWSRKAGCQCGCSPGWTIKGLKPGWMVSITDVAHEKEAQALREKEKEARFGPVEDLWNALYSR